MLNAVSLRSLALICGTGLMNHLTVSSVTRHIHRSLCTGLKRKWRPVWNVVGNNKGINLAEYRCQCLTVFTWLNSILSIRLISSIFPFHLLPYLSIVSLLHCFLPVSISHLSVFPNSMNMYLTPFPRISPSLSVPIVLNLRPYVCFSITRPPAHSIYFNCCSSVLAFLLSYVFLIFFLHILQIFLPLSVFCAAGIVRKKQWCEMVPCLEDEGCDLLVNKSGWTCTQPGGRVKTTTVSSGSLLAIGVTQSTHRPLSVCKMLLLNAAESTMTPRAEHEAFT